MYAYHEISFKPTKMGPEPKKEEEEALKKWITYFINLEPELDSETDFGIRSFLDLWFQKE